MCFFVPRSTTFCFKAKNVKLKIFLDEYKFQLYEFFFCKIQKMFILYLNPINLISNKFRSQFLVDELITCDGRYPHLEYHDNLFYNLIDFSISENKIENLNDSNESKSVLDKFENCWKLVLFARILTLLIVYVRFLGLNVNFCFSIVGGGGGGNMETFCFAALDYF